MQAATKILGAAVMLALLSCAHGNPLSAAGMLYGKALQKSALVTHLVQGAAITALGDTASQCIEARQGGGKMGGVDAGRAGRASALGAITTGYLVPSYYSMVQKKLPGRDLKSVLTKVALDGMIWGFAGNAAVISIRRALEGATPQHAIEGTMRDMPTVFRTDLGVWTTYNSFCYGIIPKPFQPASTAVMTAFWTTYLSWVSMAGKNSERSLNRPR